MSISLVIEMKHIQKGGEYLKLIKYHSHKSLNKFDLSSINKSVMNDFMWSFVSLIRPLDHPLFSRKHYIIAKSGYIFAQMIFAIFQMSDQLGWLYDY